MTIKVALIETQDVTADGYRNKESQSNVIQVWSVKNHATKSQLCTGRCCAALFIISLRALFTFVIYPIETFLILITLNMYKKLRFGSITYFRNSMLHANNKLLSTFPVTIWAVVIGMRFFWYIHAWILVD